jgi:hypothetical protein
MKIVVLGGVFILIILVGLAGYAAMSREPISKDTLPDLKGKWEGWRTIEGARDARTELEIDSDTLPLRGKFTLHDVRQKGTKSGTNEVEFDHGKIKDDNFYFKRGNNEVELSLHKDEGKMKLEGNFQFWGAKGRMTLNKK